MLRAAKESRPQEAAESGAREPATEHEYEALLDTCGAAVLIVGDDGRIVRANEEARRVFAHAGPALEGLTLLEATLSTQIDRLLREAKETGTGQRAEVALRGAAGGVLATVVTPIPADTGEPRRCLVVARDITEMRRLETVRRDFVANVSHELRTPLASIRAMAETLQDGALEDPEVAGPFLESIVTETDRLARIADDLLILSDAESRPGEDTLFTLGESVLEVVGRFQQQAARAGVALTADVPPKLQARGNPDQMEQVIVNLIDNAIKYTPVGGRVRVSAEEQPDAVVLRVSDTGIGILSQDLPRVFERFYRVDKARSRQSGGTGLGLSIVKHIVESHGGVVTVESQYNRGSTFTVSLPKSARQPAEGA